MNKKEKKLLGSKKKRAKTYDKNNSPGAGYYLISDKESKYVQFKYISDHKELKNSISDLYNPSYTTHFKFLEENKFFDMINNPDKYNKNKKYPLNLNKLPLKQRFFIENEKEFILKYDKSQTANLIFSNTDVDKNKIENEIFSSIHTFRNNYYGECPLWKFCPDYKLHFPNNNDDMFYEIQEDEFFIRSFKVFHYRNIPKKYVSNSDSDSDSESNCPNGGIAHFYSPKGAGKSILARSILTNFCDPMDKHRYNPIMFFNIKFLNELKNKNDLANLKTILMHEAYSLYDKTKYAFELVQNISSKSTIMEIILLIIKKALEDLKKLDKLKVFILDGYSFEYDSQEILKDIINLSKKNNDIKYQKFFVYIIHDILNEKDAECLYKSISPKNYINYNTQNLESYYYFETLKKFSELKKNFDENDIPENYAKIFGENVSFFFEYQTKKNKLFDDFVKDKKNEIKGEILNFYSGNNSVSKYYLTTINDYIKKEIKFPYDEILKYVPSNYIDIIIEPKPNHQLKGEDIKNYDSNKLYLLRYSYPLIKDVIKEIISDRFFINMKDPEFLNLPPAVLGINFDYEMLKIFQKLMEDEFFFEHEKKTTIFVKNIIEKNDKNSGQNHSRDNIPCKISTNQKIKEKKSSWSNIKFSDFTCIGVFQENPNGKAFDALFILREKEQKKFDMNLIQIKVSDTYKENERDIIYNVAYAKEKFSYLLDIKIDKTYLSYLSIFQKKKDFAEAHQDKTFLYDVIKEQFVNFEGIEYKNFPILSGAVIYSANEEIILNQVINKIKITCGSSFKLIKKKKLYFDYTSKNTQKIKSNLVNNEVYVKVSDSKIRYYYKINGKTGSSEDEIDDNEIYINDVFDVILL